MTEIRPFRVEVHDAAINDLRERLARTRWPEMQRVADRPNRYEQFATAIDGVDIHFLHVRSPVQGATPCVMTHGWPGSVVEFIKVIDPLVDPVGHGGEASDARGWTSCPTTSWSTG